MAYRPEWFVRMAGNRSVPCIALDLHMAVTGSSDTSPEYMRQDAELLRHVIFTWADSDKDFDACVKKLVEAALAEYENLQEKNQ